MAKLVAWAFLLVSLSVSVALGGALEWQPDVSEYAGKKRTSSRSNGNAEGGIDFKKIFTTYPDTFKKGTILINAGVGFLGQQKNISIPPILASGEYVLPIAKLPFSFGLTAGFDKSKVWPDPGIMVAGRVAYHGNPGIKNMDAFFLLDVGCYSIPNIMTTSDSKFSIDFGLGTRYFFTKNIGIFLELGLLSRQSLLRIGPSFKVK